LAFAIHKTHTHTHTHTTVVICILTFKTLENKGEDKVSGPDRMVSHIPHFALLVIFPSFQF